MLDVDGLGFLHCHVGSFGGLSVPYVYTGPLMGTSGTAVELYLKEPVIAPKLVGIEDSVGFF